MSDLKTKPNKNRSITKLIAEVGNDRRRRDAQMVYDLMKKITGEKGVIWGESIVGFGTYTYKRSTGKKYEWFAVGFSPRKSALVIYSVPCTKDFKKLVAQLGNVRSSVSCIYITDFEKVDAKVLEKIIKNSFGAQ